MQSRALAAVSGRQLSLWLVCLRIFRVRLVRLRLVFPSAEEASAGHARLLAVWVKIGCNVVRAVVVDFADRAREELELRKDVLVEAFFALDKLGLANALGIGDEDEPILTYLHRELISGLVDLELIGLWLRLRAGLTVAARLRLCAGLTARLVVWLGTLIDPTLLGCWRPVRGRTRRHLAAPLGRGW